MNSSPWILSTPGEHRKFRLYCFSYAGGNATGFLNWQAKVSSTIEICAIQLPGRGALFRKCPYTELSKLVADLALEMSRMSPLPFAFFGHSLGGLLGFELAHHNLRHGLPMPRQLFISGCSAAQFRPAPKGLHLMSNADLLEELHKYNGTPPEVLAHPELMELILPTIRADFALAERYTYCHTRALDVPITVLAGKTDAIDSPDQIDGWQLETNMAFDVKWFEGDHFFINSERDAVLRYLNEQLEPLAKYGMHGNFFARSGKQEKREGQSLA